MADKLVEDALRLLCRHYVFPARARDAAAVIHDRLAAGEYADVSRVELCRRLTTELLELCDDKHLEIRMRRTSSNSTVEEAAEVRRQHLQRLNYFIARVERMPANVGYIDLRGIAEPELASSAITAAMELVSHTHALLFDVRHNGGGSPEGVIFWHSYLFGETSVHLNSIHRGASGEVQEYWSLTDLPGRRYLDKPVYLLTSAMTFSAGEEFCYNLQAQGRATVVGETTRGGAHPTAVFPLDEATEIVIPHARSVNPVTGTNWEGTGVQPDVVVPAAEAFDVAYRMAADYIVETPGLPQRSKAEAAEVQKSQTDPIGDPQL